MADTPRGPRPTRTRTVVLTLVCGWAVVAAVLLVAAVAPRAMLEDGWERERVAITKLPYADCEGEHCTMRPTVALPDGSRETVELTIRHPDEVLPSKYFREGGTMLLWVSDDADREPQSLRPISETGRFVGLAALALAIALAAGLVTVSLRAPRRHDPKHAGHISDHVAVWLVPALTLVLSAVLLTVHLHWRTPTHDPVKPTDAPRAGQR